MDEERKQLKEVVAVSDKKSASSNILDAKSKKVDVELKKETEDVKFEPAITHELLKAPMKPEKERTLSSNTVSSSSNDSDGFRHHKRNKGFTEKQSLLNCNQGMVTLTPTRKRLVDIFNIQATEQALDQKKSLSTDSSYSSLDHRSCPSTTRAQRPTTPTVERKTKTQAFP